jgi:hypothetical protein
MPVLVELHNTGDATLTTEVQAVNQLRIMGWIDERRIEMLAEARSPWVPATHEHWLSAVDHVGEIKNF